MSNDAELAMQEYGLDVYSAASWPLREGFGCESSFLLHTAWRGIAGLAAAPDKQRIVVFPHRGSSHQALIHSARDICPSDAWKTHQLRVPAC